MIRRGERRRWGTGLGIVSGELIGSTFTKGWTDRRPIQRIDFSFHLRYDLLCLPQFQDLIPYLPSLASNGVDAPT